MLRRSLLVAPLSAAWAREQPSARQVAGQLARVYGQELTSLVYTQTLSLIGRLRLGQREDVMRLLEPWLEGRQDSLAKPTASHYSGHLVFAALDDSRAHALLVKAARMAAAAPLDNEMSDSVFMVCPLLANAGGLTGETSYFDRAAAHFERMESLCLRADGLYRHSPLAEIAWGRGNAFPLLGLALTLSKMPESHSAFMPLHRSFVALAQALARFQDKTGMWRQVIDRQEAWLEYSCTAMIATALERAVRRGWLSGRTYGRIVTSAWSAIRAHTSSDGTVWDVCESTGKMKSIDEYLQRKALRGRDARGGAVALLLATELAGLGREGRI